jgi:hypothetical protein
MRRSFSILLSIILALILLPSCAPADGFDAGRPVTPEELASLSAELFTEAAEPETSPDEAVTDGEQAPNPNQSAYWIESSTVYHLSRDCARLDGQQFIRESTVRTAEDMGFHLCKTCAGR